MIKIKSHVIVACVSLTLVACNESEGFKGSAKSKDIVAAKADATPEPEPTADATPAAPEPEIIAAEPSTVLTDVSAEETVVAGVCREKLAYDLAFQTRGGSGSDDRGDHG
ncbi:MAG: hypothetical protein EOP07_23100 [Proteobacteria bacterium]|nr:MAG: hypothetical protein EOP07_23100 [Pseudomonadota bacterium]